MPSCGTTIKIYLPSVDQMEDLIEEPAYLDDDLFWTETVLVVEDEKALRKLAAQALQGYGYTVVEAGDGREALDVVTACDTPIHLVLTDVVMPKMSGRVSSDRLRQLTPELKVLYMSGYTDDEMIHHGWAQEGFNFIQKPFSIFDLIRNVRGILNQSC